MKYFMMSRRFNKSKPEEFGLTKVDNNTYVLKEDNSHWVAYQAYDFGWGSENGFFRLPKLNFDELFELGITTTDDDNLYGAADAIINKYPDELLEKVEFIIKNEDVMKYKKLFTALCLGRPINRTFKIGQDTETIKSNFQRWKNISNHVLKISKK